MSGRTRIRVSNPGTAGGSPSIAPVRSGALLGSDLPDAAEADQSIPQAAAAEPTPSALSQAPPAPAPAQLQDDGSSSPAVAAFPDLLQAFNGLNVAAAGSPVADSAADTSQAASATSSPSPAPGLFRHRSVAIQPPSPGARRNTKDPTHLNASGSLPRGAARVNVQHAEVHIIGQLAGASGFGASSDCVAATWQLVQDPQLWLLVRGTDKGRTAFSSPGLPESDFCTWSHPLDLHLASASTNNWPGLLFKVLGREVLMGRDRFLGYAWCPLPTRPGCHQVTCPVWAPLSGRAPWQQELSGWFTELTPQLVDESFSHRPELRSQAGRIIATRGVGTLHLDLQVLMVRASLLRPLGGDALRKSLEARHAAAEGVKARAARGVAAAAAEAEEELLSEGVRLVREGRAARMTGLLATRGGGWGDSTPRGDQDFFSSNWRDGSPSRPGSSAGSPARGELDTPTWRMRSRNAVESSPGRLARGGSLAPGSAEGRLARGGSLRPASPAESRLARGGSLMPAGSGAEGETPRRGSPLNSRLRPVGAGEGLAAAGVSGGSPLRQAAGLNGSPARPSALGQRRTREDADSVGSNVGNP